MDKKKYRELLIKYYTENNSFLEKAIFTFSAGALSVLIGFSNKIHSNLYVIAICSFVLTLFLQLIAAWISKKGCDKALDKEHPENGDSWFDISETINNIFLALFILSVSLAGISILTNNNENKVNQQKASQYEQTINVKEFNYSIKKVGNINE